ncbi:MAG: MarC family protein [bacterium]
MPDSAPSFLSVWIKFFFLFTPFFALSIFLTMTDGYAERRRRNLAVMVCVAVLILCLALLFVGNQIFALFGITPNAFRIGAGALLFLSSVGLVQGKVAAAETLPAEDAAVVPLAMPIVVGPATTGTLLVLGADLHGFSAKLSGSVALLCAVACLGCVLLLGSLIERTLGSRGISILSKLTGLVLAALAAQMIMTGIQSYIIFPK